MRGRIPDDVIDKIREDTAIEQVVGHFLTLTRKGGSYWARCPFHTEKTPSFHVNTERQIFYCFGCQRGGNVFRFLMDKEGMSFPEAVEWCADRLGIDLQRSVTDREDAGPDPREGYLKANAWAEKWFAEQLAGPEGQQARAYARERGIAPETIEAFGLGWAPADGARFLRAAEEAKIDAEALFGTSLARRSEGRPPFAYFRSRLIFPIRGVAQKVYGFGGRILGPGEPKYLNTPETSVFRKRQTLYALPEARSAMVRARKAVLVEGYLDALALHQAGWTQTVATCGTAFTSEQARMLQRWVLEVVLVFDGDTAGRKAAFKSAGIAMAAGIDVRIVRLPQGHDPADLLAVGKGDEVQEALQEAPGLVECMREEVDERGGGRVLRERALTHLRGIAAEIADPVRSELLLAEAADAFGVSRHALLASASRRGSTPAPSPASDSTDQQETAPENERRLLAFALGSRRARRHLLERGRPGPWRSSAHTAIAEKLASVPPEVDAVTAVHQLGVEGTDLEPVLAGLLSVGDAAPDGADLDPVAEIDAILDAEERLSHRARSRQERDDIDAAYRSGSDEWKDRLARDRHGDDASSHPTDPS